MKSSNNYTEQKITKAMDKAGAFFAFGDEQLNKKIKKGIEYVGLGVGLICPKNTARELVINLKKTQEEGREQDKRENGKEKIILRELLNYEAFYTGEIEDTADALKFYNFTQGEIIEVYNKYKEKYMD